MSTHFCRLACRFSEDDAIEAFGKVWKELVVRIEGEAWKLTEGIGFQSEGSFALLDFLKLEANVAAGLVRKLTCAGTIFMGEHELAQAMSRHVTRRMGKA